MGDMWLGDRAVQAQRLALGPLLRLADDNQIPALAERIEAMGTERFAALLCAEGLAGAWFDFTKCHMKINIFKYLNELLKASHQNIVANALLQEHVLERAREAFAEAGVEYLVFKGVQLRAQLHAAPHHRPASDIDILVREGQRSAAARALARHGFALSAEARNASHEASFHLRGACVDLHWRLLRPGRLRQDPEPWLFQRRRMAGNLPGLEDEAALLIALVQPAFTKHVNGPEITLVQVLDLDLLLRRFTALPVAVTDELRRLGARTAAWATLSWWRHLSGDTRLDAAWRALQPGRLRRAWLGAWIRRRWTRRAPAWLRGPLFSLALQDGLPDVLRAVRALRRARREGAQSVRSLHEAVA